MLHWVYCIYVTKDKIAVIWSSGYEISECLSHGESRRACELWRLWDRQSACRRSEVSGYWWMKPWGRGGKTWRVAFCCMLFCAGRIPTKSLTTVFLLTAEGNFVLTAAVWQSVGYLIVHARIYMLISFVAFNRQANRPIPHGEALWQSHTCP